jgi:hypothetical protein
MGLVALVAAVVVPLTFGTANAAGTATWTGATDGNWNVATNWQANTFAVERRRARVSERGGESHDDQQPRGQLGLDRLPGNRVQHQWQHRVGSERHHLVGDEHN